MKYIRWFEELSNTDVGTVGGKNASLGELFHALGGAGAPVPAGFAVTAAAYRDLITRGGLAARLHELLDGIQPHETEDLMNRARQCRELIHEAELPDDLRAEIVTAYERLVAEQGRDISRLRFAARRRRKTCRKRASRVSTRVSSTSAANRAHRCVSPLPRGVCSPIARCSTGSTTASTISASRCRSASNG